jgi:hypothetical protein
VSSPESQGFQRDQCNILSTTLTDKVRLEPPRPFETWRGLPRLKAKFHFLKDSEVEFGETVSIVEEKGNAFIKNTRKWLCLSVCCVSITKEAITAMKAR